MNSNKSLKLFVKNLVLFIFLVISVGVAVPLFLIWLANGFLTFSIGDLRFLGLIPIVVGGIFMLNMFVYFALAGRGTPAPFDPPKELVTRGLFRYVRNPGYIGGVLIIIGEGLLLESVLVFVFAALMSAMFHLYVIYHEEPTLKRMFGTAYEKYLKTAPRWIPRFRKDYKHLR